MLRNVVLIAGAIAIGFALLVFLAGRGSLGSLDRGEVLDERRPYLSVERRTEDQAAAAAAVGVARSGAGDPSAKSILFGDLHVHTTVSFDAFMMSLPVLQGEGAHPPADACDYARFCSALDFWSINDHAEGVTPGAWRHTVDTIRQCNAVAVDRSNPDTVAFLGWEWTQVGDTPDDHWGHKNVVIRGLRDDEIPARPIGSAATAGRIAAAQPSALALGLNAVLGDRRNYAFATYMQDRASVPECDRDADTRDLPADCMERAATPGDLFRKLDEWDLDSIVIPHGTSWGMYTPPGSSWEKQLTREQHDPDRQTLIEVFSGHGNSEEYREWRAVEFDENGFARCPAVSDGYTPPCQQAGRLIEERCLADGEAITECASRARRARKLAARAGLQAHMTVPGYDLREWLDAGQCTDCFMPPLNHRPMGSAQFIMALSNFDEADDSGDPLRFRFGFMASSDNHYARPGTGFKEFERIGSTEARDLDLGDSPIARLFRPPTEAPSSEPVAFDRETSRLSGFQLFEMERQSSYFMTGGLIAAHSSGRDRDSIWETFERREVYGTSGPRILLWFDLLNAPASRGQRLPMGGETAMREAPIFQVRAVGSFEQEPGCPEYATESLSPDRLATLCEGECYNPSDQRRAITRIEVVRIRPQSRSNEPIEALIDDPWQRFDCPADGRGCSVTFSDPDHATAGRDTLYYVRAIEEPALAINAQGVNCERDSDGQCVRTRLCGEPGVSDIGSEGENCLSEHEPRAWSSPIFVDWPSI